MQIFELLTKVGLSQGQSKIYIQILSNPGLSIMQMANKFNINRTSLYSVINVLESKGLVGSVVIEKVVVWHPIDIEVFFEGYYCDLRFLKKNLFNMFSKNLLMPKFEVIKSKSKNRAKLFKMCTVDISSKYFFTHSNSSYFMSQIELFDCKDIKFHITSLVPEGYEFYLSSNWLIVSLDNFETCLYFSDIELIKSIFNYLNFDFDQAVVP
jgi:hypothetical protein